MTEFQTREKGKWGSEKHYLCCCLHERCASLSVRDCHLQRRLWMDPDIFHDLNEGQREKRGKEETGERKEWEHAGWRQGTNGWSAKARGKGRRTWRCCCWWCKDTLKRDERMERKRGKWKRRRKAETESRKPHFSLLNYLDKMSKKVMGKDGKREIRDKVTVCLSDNQWMHQILLRHLLAHAAEARWGRRCKLGVVMERWKEWERERVVMMKDDV